MTGNVLRIYLSDNDGTTFVVVQALSRSWTPPTSMSKYAATSSTNTTIAGIEIDEKRMAQVAADPKGNGQLRLLLRRRHCVPHAAWG